MIKKIFAITSAIFVAGLLFAQVQIASADILRGNNSSASAVSVSVSTISFSHTLGSTSNFLTLGVYESIGGGPPIPITSVMYGSQMMIPATAAGNTFIYFLVNPASGTNTITITLSGTANEYAVVASDYSGVDTLSPIDVSTFQVGDTTPLMLTATTIKDKDWAFLYMRDGTATAAAGTNSTSITTLPIFGNVAFDNQSHGNITPIGPWSMTVTNGSGAPSMHGSMIVFSAIPNPLPITTSISPASALAGSTGFTLTVNGTNFISGSLGSVVRFNGLNRVTTFVNSTQLTAQILTSDLVTPGTFPITVFNPTPGGGVSNAQIFTITSNPVPTTTSISPITTFATAGSPGFMLTVNGTNFILSSTVRFNGLNRATTFISSTQLTTQILTSDLITAGAFPVTVFNPTPGGGISNSQTFTVVPDPTGNFDVPLSTRASEATLQLLLNGDLWQRRAFEGKGFITTTNEITITPATESSFLLIRNLAASGKLHRSNNLTLTVRNEGQNVRLRIYKNPTVIADGTPVTVKNVRTTGNAPVSQVFSQPTATFLPSQLIAAYSRNADSLDRPLDLSLYLEQGESYLITVQGTATGNDYILTYTFVEE